MKVNIKGKGRGLISSSVVALGLLAGCGSDDASGFEEETAAPENEQVIIEENEESKPEVAEENEQTGVEADG